MTPGSRCLEFILERGLQRRPPGSAPPFSPSRVRRILVVRKDNIGDVLCTTPALRALRGAFPDAFLAILVAEHCRAVVDENPDLSRIFTYTKAKHRSGLLRVAARWDLARLIRDLRGQAFDLAIAMGRPCSRSSAWLAYATGAPWRLGYRSRALEPFPFFLNLGRDPGAMSSHEVDGCLELLAAIGVPPAGQGLTLVPDPAAQDRVRHRLAGDGIREGEGLALVHISNRREASRWPLDSFARAADAIHARLGLSILLSWAPGDAANPLFPGDDGRAKEVAGRMRVRPILLRTPDLADLIAAVSLSDCVLSTDGGLMHIAAALDIPQVVLFGKTGVAHWAPISEKCAVLQRDGRADRIRVDEAVEAAVRVVSRWGRGGTGGPVATGIILQSGGKA
jgi:ADP-heptose:LPS heptosyltransferase